MMVTHPATDPVRPGLTWSFVVKGNELTAYSTRATPPLQLTISQCVLLHTVKTLSKQSWKKAAGSTSEEGLLQKSPNCGLCPNLNASVSSRTQVLLSALPYAARRACLCVCVCVALGTR